VTVYPWDLVLLHEVYPLVQIWLAFFAISGTLLGFLLPRHASSSAGGQGKSLEIIDRFLKSPPLPTLQTLNFMILLHRDRWEIVMEVYLVFREVGWW
jgi:hypothetical protein